MPNGNTINIGPVPKYPRVKVQLMRPYRGFYPTVAVVQAAMLRAGLPLQELSNFYQDATAGHEENLLGTCLQWVDVEVR